ncbi:MAG: hypothetical protein FRX48_05005 [Lasallia pustulata]|uniref:Secreted protein n=1 Tax=Lasallia pustulata TaxID=136370 RepID=A0A5M8PQH9_9LECA|nr:MAG: hypothetical protein FRX48_05005 [Lasallia pustulata]
MYFVSLLACMTFNVLSATSSSIAMLIAMRILAAGAGCAVTPLGAAVGGGVGGGRERKGDECVLYWGFDGADAWAGVGGGAGSEVGVEGYALVVDGLRRAHPRVDSGVLARHWEKKRCISGCIGGEAAFETATLVFWKRGIAGLYVWRCGHAPLAYRLLPTLSSHSHSDIPRQHHLSRRQGDPDQYPAVIRQRAVQFLRSNNRTVVSPVLNRPDRGQSRRRQVVGLRHAPNSRRVRSTRWPRRNGVHAGRPHQRECSGGYTDVPGSVDLVRMDYRQKGDVGCTDGRSFLHRIQCRAALQPRSYHFGRDATAPKRLAHGFEQSGSKYLCYHRLCCGSALLVCCWQWLGLHYFRHGNVHQLRCCGVDEAVWAAVARGTSTEICIIS